VVLQVLDGSAVGPFGTTSYTFVRVHGARKAALAIMPHNDPGIGPKALRGTVTAKWNAAVGTA
jgi:hypothetical protein